MENNGQCLLLSRGTDVVKKAIEKDNSGEYDEAYGLYYQAVGLLLLALKSEKTESSKKLIRAKATEYMDRADELRVYIRNWNTGNMDCLNCAVENVERAIEKDYLGQYELAFGLYRHSLELFLQALKSEKNEKTREMIRRKMTEYMERAEKLKDHLWRAKFRGT